MRPSKISRAAVLTILVVLVASVVHNSHATFPGANGDIVFLSQRDGNIEIYNMGADGSGQTNLTNNPATDSRPPTPPMAPRSPSFQPRRQLRDLRHELRRQRADSGNGQRGD